MEKKIKVLGIVCIFSMMITSAASAQMINWERRRGSANDTEPARKTDRKTVQRTERTADSQRRTRAEVSVKTDTEKRYDFNRDDRLQENEIEAFLRYVIRQVERRGIYEIDSGILKTYDKNRDGSINRSEAKAIEQDME